MIILNSGDSLEVVLSGAVLTLQLPYYVSWVDSTISDHTPGESNGATNNTTIVTAVSSPSTTSGGLVTKRTIKYISIYNQDTAARTMFLQIRSSGTVRILRKIILNIGDVLEYSLDTGFKVTNTSGELKSTVSTGGSSAVENSDASYSASVASSGTLILPDEVLRVFSSGVLNFTGAYVPESNQVINVVF